MSPAAALRMEQRAAEALGPIYESLKAQVRHIPVVHGDETNFRIGGENGRLWEFLHATAVDYRIAPSRGQAVVKEMLQGFEGTLVDDAWDSYKVVTRRITNWTSCPSIGGRSAAKCFIGSSPDRY